MIEYVRDGAIITTEKTVFTYEERSLPNELSMPIIGSQQYFIGDYIVHPYGYNNDLPLEIRNVVQNNYLAPGLLSKKTQLLWGTGPQLYTNIIREGKVYKEWVEDQEVSDWLDSFDAENYLLQSCIDFNYIEGIFSKIIQGKGGRIGKNKIAGLEKINPNEARLATHKSKGNFKKADSVIITNYKFSTLDSIVNYKRYPLFDFTKPFEHRFTVLYSNMYSFCTDYYTIPDLYGSLEWLRRSTAVPLIFKALSENSLNVKYHIISPHEFWIAKREELKNKCTSLGKNYKESMLEEYKEKLLNQISKVLSGDSNAGKFWHTTKSFTVEGTNLLEHGWEIKAIDQNIKDFVAAQIKISQRADHALSGGISLHSALGNVSESGKSDSGSEQIYALKNYLQTGVNIPEMIVTKAINYCIRANWPNKKLKLGFNHEIAQKEQDIEPSQRQLNISP
ncbi:hypothetical protein [Flavobacterium sp. NKUCC04_CG]|uniref:hypothetical protein n=1 Tax=Flavobacterium sp. NKUCC04_CG TaxID=2842121 RepID=UPI001C5B6FF0|nr:hypothetical protein [Flavobacterium sp. NKUCC04_CG]MBW3519499.1 hypothetical protein [Flavobacterium sp. NKUCC04_CG]